MKNSNSRVDFIDIFKCLSILLVIIGHIGFANGGIKPYIYSFHMPLFFFIYGILTAIKQEKENYRYSFKISFLSKFATILVPYFIWALIFCEFSPKNLFYVIYGSHQTLNINSNSSLWFLPCYFISTLLFEILLYIIKGKQNKNSKNTYFIFFFLTILFIFISYFFPLKLRLGIPFSLEVSFMGVAFMFIGYMIKPLLSYLNKLNSFPLFILSFCSFLETLLYLFNDIGYVLMAENAYGNLFIFIITSLFGCLFILSLSMFFERVVHKEIKKLFLFLGQNTFVIFAVHKPIIAFMDIVFSKLSFSFPNFVMILITCIVCILCCSIAILFINKFIPTLNGKKMKTN